MLTRSNPTSRTSATVLWNCSSVSPANRARNQRADIRLQSPASGCGGPQAACKTAHCSSAEVRLAAGMVHATSPPLEQASATQPEPDRARGYKCCQLVGGEGTGCRVGENMMSELCIRWPQSRALNDVAHGGSRPCRALNMAAVNRMPSAAPGKPTMASPLMEASGMWRRMLSTMLRYRACV